MAMVSLPAAVTAKNANATGPLLVQAMTGEPDGAVVVDASPLRHFDSSALAVLLECQRAAGASGRAFSVRDAPPKLVALARLYGVDGLLLGADAPPANATGAPG